MAYEEVGIKGKLILELDPSSVDMLNQQMQGTTAPGIGMGAPQQQQPPQQSQPPTQGQAPQPTTPPVPTPVTLGDEDKEDNKNIGNTLGAINSGIGMGIGAFMGVMNMGLEFIEKIWKMIVDYSPGLKAVLELFEVAMQLFFVPIGTALMIEFLPIMIDLLANVTDVMGIMWDAYENDGFGAMMAVALNEALPLFFNAVISALNVMKDGPLGAIADTLIGIIEFIRDNGVELLQILLALTRHTLNIMTFLLTHLPILGAILGAMLGIQIAQLLAQVLPRDPITGTSITAPIALGVIAGTAVAGGVAGGIAQMSMAEGGMVPSTAGGQLRILGEGGEDEFVVPRSKAQGFAQNVLGGGGGTTNNFYITVPSTSEMTELIVNTIDRETNARRSRSTF